MKKSAIQKALEEVKTRYIDTTESHVQNAAKVRIEMANGIDAEQLQNRQIVAARYLSRRQTLWEILTEVLGADSSELQTLTNEIKEKHRFIG